MATTGFKINRSTDGVNFSTLVDNLPISPLSYTDQNPPNPAWYQLIEHTDVGDVPPSNTLKIASAAPSGQLLWAHPLITHNGNGSVLDVVSDRNGNVYAVGSFFGMIDLGLGDTSSYFASNVTDLFINKYDVTGNLVWSKRIGGTANDSAEAIVIDSQNNIIVGGNFQRAVDFGGTALTTSVDTREMFIAKYAPDGTFIWGNHYSGITMNTGKNLSIDTSDHLYVGGFCAFNANFGGIPLTPAGGGADLDGAVAKISGVTGTMIWARRFGGVNWEYIRSISADRFGDVIVTGYFAPNSTDLGGGTINGFGSYDIYLVKFSGTDGSYKWGKVFGSAAGDFGYGLTTDPLTGNIIMTGLLGGATNFGGGFLNPGIYLVGLDTLGNYLWSINTGNSGDSGGAVTIDSNGNMAITGRAQYALYFGGTVSLFGNGQVNAFLASFGLSGNNPPVYRWTKYLGQGLDGASAGSAVALDPTGQVIMGGAFQATIDFGGVTATGGTAGYSSAFVAKYSK